MTEDLTEKFQESFNNVENWVRENDKYAADGKIRGGNTCSKRVLSTSEAEELADSQNFRLLKAVEETSEDCLRRVANCATVVCQVLACVESRQIVLRKCPTVRCNPGTSQPCVGVLAGSANFSV